MDTRIVLELRGAKKCDIKELDLSNCKTGGEIAGLTEEFSALETLDLQNASLANIKLFPKLTSLKKLDLSGNRLSKGLEVLKECSNLSYLSLSSNKFKELDTLAPLKDLEHLTHLEIEEGNEFEENREELRAKLFETLPNLIYLDGEGRNGEEAKGDESEDDDDDVDDEEDGEEEEDESGDDDEESDSEEEGPGLAALYDNTANLDEDDDSADFEADDAEAAEDDDEDIDDDDEDEEASGSKGVKRKLEDD